MSHVDLESLFKALAAADIEDYTLQAYQQLATPLARLEYIKEIKDELRTAFEAKQQAIGELETEVDNLRQLEADLEPLIGKLRFDLSIDPVKGQLPLLPHDPSEAVSQAQSTAV